MGSKRRPSCARRVGQPPPEKELSLLPVLAVDPGSGKCGLALAGEDGADLGRGIVDRSQLAASVGEWLEKGGVTVIVLGDGTSSKACARELAAALGHRLPPVEFVDERASTLEARPLYFAGNPPRGLWRLVPLSLQTPGRPYDDYAALVLARRWLALRRG